MLCQSMYYTGILLLKTIAISSWSKSLRHWGMRLCIEQAVNVSCEPDTNEFAGKLPFEIHEKVENNSKN